MNIGLTGGIASGKSTVSAMLTELGAALVDADRIAREVVGPGTAELSEIARAFGEDVLHEDGTLNRKRLGAIVFADAAQRKRLEQIVHPAIRRIMRQRMAELEKADPKRLVVVDVPLLFESGLQGMFERVMLVYVPPDVQLKRLMARDDLTREQALDRIGAQMPMERKRELADIIIDNSGSKDETREQVLQFWRESGL